MFLPNVFPTLLFLRALRVALSLFFLSSPVLLQPPSPLLCCCVAMLLYSAVSSLLVFFLCGRFCCRFLLPLPLSVPAAALSFRPYPFLFQVAAASPAGCRSHSFLVLAGCCAVFLFSSRRLLSLSASSALFSVLCLFSFFLLAQVAALFYAFCLLSFSLRRWLRCLLPLSAQVAALFYVVCPFSFSLRRLLPLSAPSLFFSLFTAGPYLAALLSVFSSLFFFRLLHNFLGRFSLTFWRVWCSGNIIAFKQLPGVRFSVRVISPGLFFCWLLPLSFATLLVVIICRSQVLHRPFFPPLRPTERDAAGERSPMFYHYVCIIYALRMYIILRSIILEVFVFIFISYTSKYIHMYECMHI